MRMNESTILAMSQYKECKEPQNGGNGLLNSVDAPMGTTDEDDGLRRYVTGEGEVEGVLGIFRSLEILAFRLDCAFNSTFHGHTIKGSCPPRLLSHTIFAVWA